MELLPSFKLARPRTVEEAIAARAQSKGARLVAGGTDLIPNMRRGIVDTDLVVDLTGVDELSGIAVADGGLRIGAAATLADVAENADIRRDYPAVAKAAGSVAGPTHRTMGTVGGNLCLDTRCIFYNQSEWWRRSNDYCLKYRGTICHVVPTSKRCYAAYSGDLAAALLIADAEVEIAGPAGRQSVPIADLFLDDGADHLTLADDELVVAVHLSKPTPGAASAYDKIRVRGSIDFPLAGVAVALLLEDGRIAALRVGLTGVACAPIHLDATAALNGGVLDEDACDSLDRMVQKAVSPVRTGLIQPQYRRRAVAALAVDMALRLARS